MRRFNRAVSVAALVVAVVAVALLTWGCQQPTEPSPVNVYVNQAANQTQGGPSPSPGTSGLPEGSTVHVFVYGSSCPGGGQA